MNLFYTPDIFSDTYVLSEQESKHCIRVLRFAIGDRLTLVDGNGGWYETKIIDANPKKCKVEVLEKKFNFGKRNFYTHIAIAPTKNIDRFEWFVEKATEFGIDEITPILCDHSERKILKTERIEKVAIAAMKQSLKAFLPKINALTSITDVIKNTPIQQKFIAHCEDTAKVHFMKLVPTNAQIIILVGPEGDFSISEIELALKNNFQPISLGESRLRTETAGVAACHIANLVNE